MNQNEKETIHLLEEISLNAWPSHKMELYDGWLIRYSYNYTYRTNSVQQVGRSLLPIEEKVRYCEQIYKAFHTPAIFKISPLIDPAFDRMLQEQGYQRQHETSTMVMDMEDFQRYPPVDAEYEFYGRNSGLPSNVAYPDDVLVQLRDRITEDWITALFHLNGTTNPTLRRIVPSMYQAIPKETIVAKIELNGRMVASGLGILDRGYCGIYAIYVDPSCRGKHYARAIVSTLLSESERKGCWHAYLQVVRHNQKAISLYRSLGFHPCYEYWFREKRG